MKFKTQLANMVIAEFMRNRTDDIDRYEESYLLNNSYLLFQGINFSNDQMIKLDKPKNYKLIQQSYDSIVGQIVDALKPFVKQNGITVLKNPYNWTVTNARKTTITNSRKAPSLSKQKLQFNRIEFVIKNTQHVEIFDIYPRIVINQLTGVFLVSKPIGKKTLWEDCYNLNSKYECIENFSAHSHNKTFKNAFIVDFNFTNRLSNYLEMIKGIADGSLHDEVVKIRNQSKINTAEIRNAIADIIGKGVGFQLSIQTDFKNQKNEISFVGDVLIDGSFKKNHVIHLVIDGTDVNAIKPYLKLFTLNGLTNQ